MNKPTLALKSKQAAGTAVNPDIKVRLADLQRQAPVAKPVPPPAPSGVPERAPWPLIPQYQILKDRLPVIAEFKPLAIGVKTALLEMAAAGSLGITPKELVEIMRVHSWSPKYLKALANDGAYRHDLEGNPVEPVADDHRRYACEQILKRDAARRNRKSEKS